MIGGFSPHQYQQTSTSLRDANTAPFQVELLVAGTRYSCQPQVTYDEIRQIAAGHSYVIIWGNVEFADVFKTQRHNHFCVAIGVNSEASD